MAKTEEEKKTTTAVAVSASGSNLPAELLEELAADAGAGTSQDASDNVIPFIVLLQDMSPETKKRDPEYVEGAEPGMYLNRASKKLYAGNAEQARETGLPLLEFQHAAFDRKIVQWIPRNDGGGFVASHDLVNNDVEATMAKIGGKQIDDPQDPNKKIWRTADGKHDLIDTRYHYGHVIGENGPSAAVIAFSSTGHTASREWMTMMNDFKVPTPSGLRPAPAWAKKYVIKSRARKNNKGDFFVSFVEDGGVIADRDLRDLGKRLNEAFSTGAVRAAETPAEGGATSEMPI